MWTDFLPRAWRDTFGVYAAQDRESGPIRARHLSAVLRLTPYLMAANAVNAAVVVWALRDRLSRSLWLWVGALCLLAAWALWGWWRARGRIFQTASPRAVQRATLHAALLATVWAVVPVLWFGSATRSQQVLIAVLTTGMMGAGAYALSPLPAASLAYVAVLALASCWALWSAGEPLFGLVAVLLLSYAAVVALGVMASARRGTALLRAERVAARQGRMVSVLLQDFEDHAAEALWETGRDGSLTHVSARLHALLGGGAGTLQGAALLTLLHAHSASAAAALRAAMGAGRPFRDLRLPLPASEGLRWWAFGGKPLFDDTGRADGWRGVIADVTEEVLAQERLRHLAHFDSLTDLANRLTLHETLRAAMQRGAAGALLSIDLDHFKAVNDSMGHSAGDAVLNAVAARLRGSVRPGDLVARLGGDEFAVLLLSQGTAEEAQALAQRLVAALQEPVAVAGRRLRVGASIGVALLGQHGSSVDELLGNADLALYDAKENGRGRHAFFAPHLGERNRRRTTIEQGLRHAVELEQLQLYWQPKVDVATWAVVGAEALVRWHHPVLGGLEPTEFIAVAEQAGLIHDVGGWVLREACRTAATRLPGLGISVNVSPIQLRDGDFLARTREALAESGLDPARLELEITETIFIDDVAGAIEQLHALRQLGVRIALDDFGTGYSSLAYLRRFPFDTLKIDRAFVHELLLRDDAKAIVRMIAGLARALGMCTVAEGVETAAQLAIVEAAGCQQIQGFLAAQALHLPAFVELRQGWGTGRPASLQPLQPPQPVQPVPPLQPLH